MRILSILSLILSACATAAPPPGDAVLAIGDSVMAWNGDHGIPEAVESTLGRPVVDRSQSLARLTNASGLAGVLGFDITRQFRGGDWDWVILTGGGNDLRDTCLTPAEDDVLSGLIDAELTGDVPRLIGHIRTTGAKVAFVGYYDGVEGQPGAFAPCQGAFDTINARMTRLAAERPGVLFFDAGEVIDPRDAGLYDGDFVHPSPRGAALIGRELARRMLTFEEGGRSETSRPSASVARRGATG
ncbi:SGNH/GDSL hydrolase family protein [Jannaschia rubra]|uniref:SGNH hydrolase-type esterase domain-containing protein n=1 Tax=Jannaschia rubra TaxID=282197 RepID=A0A0M6XKA0_9RHOB|nr:SGNH/GDSL hydrolase family protein [Jannaschia rubra]CTQ31576.1 hypothetical protein JAN5088_00334 [Jannaschia rubra]SFF76969.1 Lysophospholipase L1 [Jannaschia rubra]